MRSRPRNSRRHRREAERCAARADRHLAVRLAAEGADAPDRPLSGVSAAVLIAFRHRMRETPAQVARREGLASGTVVRGIETGDQPACTLPVPVIEAVGAAMRESGEASLADLFEAGTWCEAALTGLLIGNLDAAAKGLKAHFLAGHWPVLYWALGGIGQPWPDLPPGPLFGRAQVAAIRQRAAVLAASPLPEAWVGDELLDLYEPGCALCLTHDEKH